MISLEGIPGGIVFLCVAFSCVLLFMTLMFEYLGGGLTKGFYRALVVSIAYTTAVAAVVFLVSGGTTAFSSILPLESLMLGNTVELGKLIVDFSLVLAACLFLGMFLYAFLSGGIPSRWARRISATAFSVFFVGVLSGTVISDRGRVALQNSFEVACIENGGDTVEQLFDGAYQCWDISGERRIFFEFNA